jgi:hypothetical protein
VLVVAINGLTTGKRKSCGCAHRLRGDHWRAALARATARPTIEECVASILTEVGTVSSHPTTGATDDDA